jgi:hypothetical protein
MLLVHPDMPNTTEGKHMRKKLPWLAVLLVMGFLISPLVSAGTVSGGVSSSGNLRTLNYLAYTWYHMYSKQFNESYQKAVELGVDNETLQEALAYHEKAVENYQKALELSKGAILAHLGDFRLLSPLRNAYVNEMKAVKLLKEAIKKLSS